MANRIVLSHLNGNAFVRAVAKGFVQQDMLQAYYTSFATFPGQFSYLFGALPFLKEIRRRTYEPDIRMLTKTRPMLELGRMFATKAGFDKLVQGYDARFNVNKVMADIDQYVAHSLKNEYRKGADAVYCYEDTAFYTFQEAERLNMRRIYDLPIGYWKAAKALLQEEYERHPEWIPTMVGMKDPVEKLNKKDEELRKAESIIVASSFTANTLKYFEGNLAPVKIIPYAFPEAYQDRRYGRNTGPLKILFVGGLSQRKGLADLLYAVDVLGKHIEFTIVGRKPTNECKPLNDALARYRWFPSLPHHEVLKLMRSHDVVVFPSLFEGFGLVITEAMSQGTPVITTDRTAGPDLIEHGKNGWLIKAGSSEAITGAIEELLEDRSKIESAGRNAITAASLRTWDQYSAEIAMTVQTS